MANFCRAEKREEPLVEYWEESMGNNTEVFFPTKFLEGMTEEEEVILNDEVNQSFSSAPSVLQIQCLKLLS